MPESLSGRPPHWSTRLSVLPLGRGTSGPMVFIAGTVTLGDGAMAVGRAAPIHEPAGFVLAMRGVDTDTECIQDIGTGITADGAAMTEDRLGVQTERTALTKSPYETCSPHPLPARVIVSTPGRIR